ATCVTSVYLKHSLFQVVSITGFILAGTFFPLVELRRIEEIERVIRVYLITGAIVSVYGIIQVIRSPLPFERAAFWIGEGVLYNHGPFAAFLGFAMGPAFVYLISEKFTVRQVPVLIAASLMTIATVVSLTRAAWVATAVLLLVFAAVRARLFLKKMLGPLVIAVVILIPVFLNSPAAKRGMQNYWEVSTSLEYASNVERLNRWLAALRMFADRPVTGVGPGTYEIAYEEYRSVDFTRERRGTHSEILRVASEMGVPGVFFFSMMVIVFFRTGLRLMRHGSSPRVRRLAAGLCAGMLTYAVHGQFNEYFRTPKIAITMWVFAGMLAALERLDREGDPGPAGTA
ncbi:MAG: O-antigen ligase family protein, partial [Gemmatimonadetes bacterium]|nr:O-antigen ligase family protein [Gemmatimonadota bacterium]